MLIADADTVLMIHFSCEVSQIKTIQLKVIFLHLAVYTIDREPNRKKRCFHTFSNVFSKESNWLLEFKSLNQRLLVLI